MMNRNLSERCWLHSRMDVPSWSYPNHSETKLLCITRSKQASSIHLNIAAHRISPSPSVKYLCVLFMSNLTWPEHIKVSCKAAKRHLSTIHRNLHQAPVEVCRRIVNTAFLPKLECCWAVWDPHHKQDISLLGDVQKFGRWIILERWSSDIKTFQSELSWVPLKLRRRSS